jgi:hypothetical protein
MVEERLQKRHQVVLWMIDPNQAKDQLHRLIHDPDRTKWLPHSQVNADYCSQMCSESRVYNPSTGREEWVEIVKNNNHLWDAEVIQCAVAWRIGCGLPQPQPAPAETEEHKPDGAASGGWSLAPWKK